VQKNAEVFDRKGFPGLLILLLSNSPRKWQHPSC